MAIEKKIDATNFRLQFYLIDEYSKEIIRKAADKQNVGDFIDILESIQNSEIPIVLNSSSILLLLANKSKDGNSLKGIMGTKIFEYLAVEKPILCVRNDEDCLEKTINEANAGIAASTVDQVEGFILEKYNEWKQNGFTHQKVNKNYIQQFSRKYQAKQFVDLFEEIINININKQLK